MARRANSILGCIRKMWPQVERCDPDTLHDPNEATSGVLCSIMVSTVQERQGANGEGPAEQHKDGLGSGAPL